MNADFDLDLLTEHRPQPAGPSQATTDRARAALVGHAARRRRADRRRTGGLAAIGVVGAGAAALALTIGLGDRHASHRTHQRLAVRPPAAHRPHRLAPAPVQPHTLLARLAVNVGTMPSRPQPGDATLVVRDTVVDGSHRAGVAVYGGYDLYTDAGRYYYAPFSLAQLQQLYNTHQVSVGSGNETKALRTIAKAAAGTPAQARAAVLRTEPRDGRPPTKAEERRFLREMPKEDRRRFAAGARHLDVRLYEDSDIWSDATQALAVGAGQPQVRAASIKALSTLHGVTQTRTRIDGVAAVKVSFPEPGDPERIWLDAATGVPIQEKDGDNSATRFVVERVTAAHLPKHLSPRALLR